VLSHWKAPASLARVGGMYSTRSVGSCFKRTRRSVGQSFSLRATHHRPQVPAPCVSSRGPGGNRTCLAMYSTAAVERVSVCIKRTDEVVAGDFTVLYQVELQRYVRSTALVRFEPTTPGSQSMYSKPAVGLLSLSIKAQRGSCRDDGFGGCSPGRQLGLYYDHPTRKKVQTGSS
jgi:hypothetical protein